MASTTPGKILLKRALPERYHSFVESGPLTSDRIDELMDRVMAEKPDDYKDILQELHNIGEEVSRAHGGQASLSPSSFLPNEDLATARAKIEEKLNSIWQQEDTPIKEKEQQTVDFLSSVKSRVEDLVKKNLEGTSLGAQMNSGVRGGTDEAMALLTGELVPTDEEGNPVPIPVTRGFAEGLTPSQYWATAQKARTGLIGVKLATPEAGDISNQLMQAVSRLRVTRPKEPRAKHGLPINPHDPDYEGSILAQDIPDVAQEGDKLTPSVIRDLKDKGINRVMIHSPITSQVGKGISKESAGSALGGPFPVGSWAGVQASQSLSEPFTQASIGCIAEGTPVRMADGSTREVQDIKPGEEVLGCSKDGTLKPTKVREVLYQGVGHCVRSEYRLGGGSAARGEGRLVFEGTADHEILTEYVDSGNESEIQLRPVNTLREQKSHDVCARLSEDFDDTGKRDEEFAFILGLLVADGSYTGNDWGVHLSCFGNDVLDYVQNYLAGHGFKLSGLGNDHGFHIVDVKAGRNENRLLDKIRNEEMFGQYSKDKTLPVSIYQWSNQAVADFVSGFITGDGWITDRPAIHIGCTAESVVRGIRDLLGVRFGTWGSAITVKTPMIDGRKYNKSYKFLVGQRESVEKLHEVLNIPGPKGRHLDDIQHHEYQYRTNSYRSKRINVTITGEQELYDLHVEHPDHLFMLANGLIVSNSKHTGQRAGAGLGAVRQLIEVPSSFPGGAAIAENPGRVTDIKESDSGGKIIETTQGEHHLAPGLEPKVEKGDQVKIGQVLSSGMPNPAKLTNLLGIGEGRRRFMNILSDTFKKSGIPHNKRNVEYLARGLVNHVRMKEPYKEWVPGDLVEFSHLQNHYQPREGAEERSLSNARDHYLEEPVAHYTVGTKLTPAMVEDLKDLGYEKALTHDKPPPFEPEMRRAREALHHAPDWAMRMGGSGLKRNVMKAVQSERAPADPEDPSNVFGQLLFKGKPEEVDEDQPDIFSR